MTGQVDMARDPQEDNVGTVCGQGVEEDLNALDDWVGRIGVLYRKEG